MPSPEVNQQLASVFQTPFDQCYALTFMGDHNQSMSLKDNGRRIKSRNVIYNVERSREHAVAFCLSFGEKTTALLENKCQSETPRPGNHKYSDVMKSFSSLLD